ncbi:MAG: hypothetical protein FRX49_13387 [Trebouxia sp. A1-2]|nr:MAG: hypothetical protein FRX49_13387 [Trebouxia sp. A1-2]
MHTTSSLSLLTGSLPVAGGLLQHAAQLQQAGLVWHAVAGADLVPEVPAGVDLPDQVARQGAISAWPPAALTLCFGLGKAKGREGKGRAGQGRAGQGREGKGGGREGRRRKVNGNGREGRAGKGRDREGGEREGRAGLGGKERS